MSIQYVCDRCGKTVSSGAVLNYKDVGALLAVQVTISDGSGASLKGSQIRDLCPACKDSLVAFLEGAAVKVIR